MPVGIIILLFTIINFTVIVYISDMTYAQAECSCNIQQSGLT